MSSFSINAAHRIQGFENAKVPVAASTSPQIDSVSATHDAPVDSLFAHYLQCSVSKSLDRAMSFRPLAGLRAAADREQPSLSGTLLGAGYVILSLPVCLLACMYGVAEGIYRWVFAGDELSPASQVAASSAMGPIDVAAIDCSTSPQEVAHTRVEVRAPCTPSSIELLPGAPDSKCAQLLSCYPTPWPNPSKVRSVKHEGIAEDKLWRMAALSNHWVAVREVHQDRILLGHISSRPQDEIKTKWLQLPFPPNFMFWEDDALCLFSDNFSTVLHVNQDRQGQIDARIEPSYPLDVPAVQIDSEGWPREPSTVYHNTHVWHSLKEANGVKVGYEQGLGGVFEIGSWAELARGRNRAEVLMPRAGFVPAKDIAANSRFIFTAWDQLGGAEISYFDRRQKGPARLLPMRDRSSGYLEQIEASNDYVVAMLTTHGGNLADQVLAWRYVGNDRFQSIEFVPATDEPLIQRSYLQSIFLEGSILSVCSKDLTLVFDLSKPTPNISASESRWRYVADVRSYAARMYTAGDHLLVLGLNYYPLLYTLPQQRAITSSLEG